jgi:DNA processing protein
MNHFFFALLHSLGLSHKKLALISPEKVENFYEGVSIQKLLQIGIIEDAAIKIVDKKNVLNVERIEGLLREKNIRIIHKDDEEYPQLLINIPDAPTILYVRGKLPDHDALISVVGSRRHSGYAQSCLEKILPDLIRSGYTIVSGGAYGIDSLAHEITLKNKGQTLVVFGAGIDVVYPVTHARLFEDVIAGGGALISQFPLGTLAEPYNFPLRNTVVAGMSRGTLIAEAGEDSGTLITARLALEYNRDVFIIPADITRE